MKTLTSGEALAQGYRLEHTPAHRIRVITPEGRKLVRCSAARASLAITFPQRPGLDPLYLIETFNPFHKEEA